MTKEFAIALLKQDIQNSKQNISYRHNEVGIEALDLAIKALEQQPCEDMEVIQVSKGALKSRQGRFVIYDVDWLKKNFYLEEKLYGHPKQPKRGKWIEDKSGIYHCSNCNEEAYWDTDYGQQRFNYCPECGSDNREEADE